MLKKKKFECRLRRVRPSSRLRKSLLFEISSAVSFHSGELKLVPKYKQMNKISCGIANNNLGLIGKKRKMFF